MPDTAAAPGYPRLTYLRIKNYRALRDVELRDLTPLTVLIGPNGSGKSTILDALAFLAEAVSGNLQQAWEKRNRFAGMRTRGQEGPIEFRVVIDSEKVGEVVYIIQFEEKRERIIITKELVKLYDKTLFAASYNFDDDTTDVKSSIVSEFQNESSGHKILPSWLNGGSLTIDIDGQPVLAVRSTVTRLFKTFLAPLYAVIPPYRLVHLTDDHLKGYSDAGPREKLSANGDNLPNVLYYLHERHPEALARITAQLRRWVPQLADVVPEITSDERLLLRFKDAAFEKPLPAQYMSDGTMRLAALLTLLYEPNATGLLGLEEPENELYPRLLPRLAEELLKATETRQLLVATHSPALLNSMEPEQVWILHRGADGYTQASRVADMPDIVAMVEEGSPLGYLWSRNFFEVGDPLTSPSSTPTQE